MKVNVYTKYDGSEVILTDPQRIALEHAGLWRQSDVRAHRRGATWQQPTHTDGEIADMITKTNRAAIMTHIARKRRPYRDTLNLIVRDPKGGSDMACSSIETALDSARSTGAIIVTVHAEDMRDQEVKRTFYGFAAERGMTVLTL